MGPEAEREDLARWVPLEARRVLHCGARGAAFEAACLRRNPQARVTAVAALDAPVAGAFEAAVVGDLGQGGWNAAGFATLAAAMSEAGVLVAGVSGAVLAEVVAALQAAGFEILTLRPNADEGEAFNDTEARFDPARIEALADRNLVLTARRRGAHPTEPLVVQIGAFAPLLMDIRTRLPAEALRADPDLLVAYGSQPIIPLALPVDQPKIIVLQRPTLSGVDAWRSAMAQALRGGWVPILELDDHPALLAAVKGGKVEAKDWTQLGYVLGIQTSTARLAKALSPYNPEVKVFENAVFSLPPFPEAPAGRRVFYGALARGRLAVRVAQSLGPVCEAFPEVAFDVVGDQEVFEALPTTRKTFHKFMPYADYLDLMGASAVSLSPIEGRPHEDTKSDAKFLDAAARGVLTIASPTIYGETIRHGTTGLIAHGPKDWPKLLARALGDEPQRQAMARRAWEYVRDTRMFAHQAADRRDWYRSLWDRRAELRAGLMQRLPGLAGALAALGG